MDVLISLAYALPLLAALALIASCWTCGPLKQRKNLLHTWKALGARLQIRPSFLEGESGKDINSLDDILIAEGLGARREFETLRESSPTRSTLSVLLELNRIDERRFTSIWSRVSGFESTIVIPEDIDPSLMDQWPESTAKKYQAIPISSSPHRKISVAFVEPPSTERLRIIEKKLGEVVIPRLIPPSNLASLCDEIYPERIFGHRRIPFKALLDSLDTKGQRSAREIQMRNRCSLGEALQKLSIRTDEELREINALAIGTEPTDLSTLTLGMPLLRTLTPLFCELHGILPLSNGALAINHTLHSDTNASILNILGSTTIFQSDTPSAFSKLWKDFTALRFSQDIFLDHLLSVEILSIANAERIREARRLLKEPLDRVLLRLGLANSQQIFHAIRTTSELEIADQSESKTPPIEGILSLEQSARSGIVVNKISRMGVTCHTARLPSPTDPCEIMRRCDGIPWKFELSPAMREEVKEWHKTPAGQAWR
jgi:hypothetical protein